MTESVYQPTKLFTVSDANAALPLVRAIVRDIVSLSQSIAERRPRLDYLKARHRVEAADLSAYADELAQAERDLARDMQQLREYAAELAQLGVELKSAPEGLVDFPAELGGRLVYLCWKYDEPEVLFWHELDAGFAGRQPLPRATSASRN